MSAKFESLVKALSDVIKSPNKDTEPFDTVATVTRIDGDTAFVHIPGGVAETPVSLTISCKEGDSVQVRVGGGKAWLVGNASAPPTDDTTANTAIRKTGVLGDQLTKVQKIAGNTNQYFWHTETGDDTGSHITEIPQERFLASPGNGGGNLLLRSNGIAIRNGLSELATFSSTAIQFNQPGTNTVVATIGTSGLYIQKGIIKIGLKESATDTTHTGFFVDENGNASAYTLRAQTGTIGGYTLTSTALYNGISSASASSGTGIYLGTDGINLGGGKFKVSTAGALTSTSGTIGGWTINAASLSRVNGSSTIYLNNTGIEISTGNYVTSMASSNVTVRSGSGISSIDPGIIDVERLNGNGYVRAKCSASTIAIVAQTNGTRGLWDDMTSHYLISENSSYVTVVQGHETRLVSRAYDPVRFVSIYAGDASVPYFNPSHTNEINLGSTTYRWKGVYGYNAYNSASDLKHKKVITDHDWKIDEFISGLKPIAYRNIDEDGNESNRIRMGFGAQDVAKLVKELGIGDLRLYEASIMEEAEDGKILSKEYHGEDIDDSKLSWSLGYTELIAPMVLEIQQLMNRLSELEARLNG